MISLMFVVLFAAEKVGGHGDKVISLAGERIVA
jgi:hypothetical protein